MLDDEFEDRLKDAARDYNLPPETPRDAMWAAIQAGRRTGGQADGTEQEKAEAKRRVLTFRRSARPLVRLAAGIAAVLALGFALGRFSEKGPPPPAQVAAVAETPARPGDAAYRVATTEHLSQSEAFLTLFRASVRRGGNERLASATARQLLATNRLLLDSPAASDAKTRALLQDLELVLAEIAQLSPRPPSGDLELIKEGMEERGMMTRLRTAVPSGPSTTQGAL
jgi:hypothetical protein